MEPKKEDESKKEKPLDEEAFYDRPFEKVEDGFYDERGFYTTPNGSFWDDQYNYFNHLGFDIHGGTYDKFGVYHPGPDYDEKLGLYKDQKELYPQKNIEDEKPINLMNDLLGKKIPIDINDSDDEDYIPEEDEESESDFEDDEGSGKNNNSSSSENRNIEEIYNEIVEKEQEKKEGNSGFNNDKNCKIKKTIVSNIKKDDIIKTIKPEKNENKPLSVVNINDIILKEILNPEIYTGIIERDFHIYVKSKNSHIYLHIEPDTKPKCSCQIDEYSYDEDDGKTERCKHVRYILDNVLHLDINKDSYIYSEEELKNAFANAEKNNNNIIRETYGLVVRKNFDFPNPKVYKYEYNEDNDEDGYESHEWRIKERLYARGIVAEDFHLSDNDYSITEEEYNQYFRSEKEAKPTQKCYEQPKFEGKQLKLDKKFKEEEKY